MNYQVPYTVDEYDYPSYVVEAAGQIHLPDDFLKWPNGNPLDRIKSDPEELDFTLHFFPEHESNEDHHNIVLRPHLQLYFEDVEDTGKGYSIWLPGADFTRAATKWGIKSISSEDAMSKLAQALEQRAPKAWIRELLADLHVSYSKSAVKYMEAHFEQRFIVQELGNCWTIEMRLLDRGAAIWSTTFELRSEHIDNLLAKARGKKIAKTA